MLAGNMLFEILFIDLSFYCKQGPIRKRKVAKRSFTLWKLTSEAICLSMLFSRISWALFTDESGDHQDPTVQAPWRTFCSSENMRV
jgi:hypothetical protein